MDNCETKKGKSCTLHRSRHNHIFITFFCFTFHKYFPLKLVKRDFPTSAVKLPPLLRPTPFRAKTRLFIKARTYGVIPSFPPLRNSRVRLVRAASLPISTIFFHCIENLQCCGNNQVRDNQAHAVDELVTGDLEPSSIDRVDSAHLQGLPLKTKKSPPYVSCLLIFTVYTNTYSGVFQC